MYLSLSKLPLVIAEPTGLDTAMGYPIERTAAHFRRTISARCISNIFASPAAKCQRECLTVM
jgi:hypothetical protein